MVPSSKIVCICGSELTDYSIAGHLGENPTHQVMVTWYSPRTGAMTRQTLLTVKNAEYPNLELAAYELRVK